MTEQNLLCKYKAGSYSYGLETPTSDLDYRGVYLLDDVGLIVDPYKYMGHKSARHLGDNKGEIDESYHELRHFFHILRSSNTNAVEMLFNCRWEFISPEFQCMINNRTSLLDPDKFYRSLKGYIQSELRLAVGERTGKLGSKRQESVEKYGYSPKNMVQLLRLTYAGSMFFETGEFPVDLTAYAKVRNDLYKIKTNPGAFQVKELIGCVNESEHTLDQIYNSKKFNRAMQYRFDEEAVTAFTLLCYSPKLKQHMPRGTFMSRLRDLF